MHWQQGEEQCTGVLWPAWGSCIKAPLHGAARLLKPIAAACQMAYEKVLGITSLGCMLLTAYLLALH